MMHLTHQPISIELLLKQKPAASCGASAFFVGTVRNHDDGKLVTKLYYECYEPMAEREIGSIVERVKQECGVDEIQVLHRAGWLEVGDHAVAIAVYSAHRKEAFEACRAVIDEIKKSVPIWKKEFYADGASEWAMG